MFLCDCVENLVIWLFPMTQKEASSNKYNVRIKLIQIMIIWFINKGGQMCILLINISSMQNFSVRGYPLLKYMASDGVY